MASTRNFGEDDVGDAVIIGAEWMKFGLTDQKEWAAKVIIFFGEGARPYLGRIWNSSILTFELMGSNVSELPQWSDQSDLPQPADILLGVVNSPQTDSVPELKNPEDVAPIQSVLPGINPAQEQEEQAELLKNAHEFAREWIGKHKGSANEFVTALVGHFGPTIKMLVIDLINSLYNDPTLIRIQREYIETTLSIEEIREVLQGKITKQPPRENTLDELFARSSMYRSSAAFVEAVNFVAKLREYAPYNNMLVYIQRPTATFWATASHWRKQFGRHVKNDAIPLIMLQPMGPIMLVYDVADTEGPPLPEQFINPFAVVGEFDQGILNMTLKNCEVLGIGVVNKGLGSLHAGSAIRWPHKEAAVITIELNKDLDAPSLYATLCHELAHIHLGHLGGHQDGAWPARLGLSRNQRELEAEAAAYMVCFRANLTTKSAEYLAGYLSSQSELGGISIDLVMKVAGLIERMGKEVIRSRKKAKHSEQARLPT